MKLRFAVIALSASLACASAPASAYTALYAFGDSLSDVGNVFAETGGAIPAAPYYMGRFSNGPNWVDDLSDSLGLGPVAPSLLGGNNFAYGGAQTGPTDVNPGPVQTADLLGQVATFSALGAPKAGALYTLDIGANDIGAALGALALNEIDYPTFLNVISEAESNTIEAVQELYADGARSLIYYEVPDLALVPAFAPFGTDASLVASGFNQVVLAGIESIAGLTVFDLPIYDQLDQIVANPNAFGFTDVTDPCYTGTTTSPGIVCSALPAVQNQYLFWDHEHPTAAGHALAANLAYSLAAPEPATWAMLLIGFVGLGVAGRAARRAPARLSV